MALEDVALWLLTVIANDDEPYAATVGVFASRADAEAAWDAQKDKTWNTGTTWEAKRWAHFEIRPICVGRVLVGD
jgi:hypothetical protein